MAGYCENGWRLTRPSRWPRSWCRWSSASARDFAIGLGRDPTGADRTGSFAAGLFAGPVVIDSFGAAGAACKSISRRSAPAASSACPCTNWPIAWCRSATFSATRARHCASGWKRTFVAGAYRHRGSASSPSAYYWARPRRRPCARHSSELKPPGERSRRPRLAQAAGWSRKHLAARFRDEIGIGPKAVARIVRINRAIGEARSAAVGWADIAAGCGFADQAHMTREFQALVGVSPTAWQAGIV